MEQHWLLKRNCSLSPRHSVLAIGALCAVLLIVGCVFALFGLWPVLAFAWLHVLALVAALLSYASHAGDRERIALTPDCLLIERVEGDRVCQTRLDPCWTRIVPPAGRFDLIHLEARGVQVDVGGFIDEPQRTQVALELRRQLRLRSAFQSPAP